MPCLWKKHVAQSPTASTTPLDIGFQIYVFKLTDLLAQSDFPVMKPFFEIPEQRIEPSG